MSAFTVDDALEFANLIFKEADELILFNAVVEVADDRLETVVIEGDDAAANGLLAGEYALFGIVAGSVYFASYSLEASPAANANADDLKSVINALPGSDAPDVELLDDLAAAGALTIAALIRSVNDRGERLVRLYHHGLLTPEDAGAFLKDAMKQYEQKPPPN